MALYLITDFDITILIVILLFVQLFNILNNSQECVAEQLDTAQNFAEKLNK